MMSTAPPTYAILRISPGEAAIVPNDTSSVETTGYGLALIDLDQFDTSAEPVFDQAMVAVNEPTLPDAVRAFQARCVADLGLDPVDLRVYSMQGNPIGTGRSLGLRPNEPV
jgi:hypothetical protein